MLSYDVIFIDGASTSPIPTSKEDLAFHILTKLAMVNDIISAVQSGIGLVTHQPILAANQAGLSDLFPRKYE